MLPPPTSPPAGRHRHGQVRLLAALRVARTPQQCGRPHQLRPVENIQQLRFCVSTGKDRFRMFRYKDVSRTRTTTKKKKDLYVSANQQTNDSSQRRCFFHPGSPSICHSDSDLSDGSRKYSPCSETSVETQRACGKKTLPSNMAICTHTHTQTRRRGLGRKSARSLPPPTIPPRRSL